MAGKNITLKLDDKLHAKLSDIASALNLQSPNLAAKQIIVTALSGAYNNGEISGSPDVPSLITEERLYSIQADIQHLSLQTEGLITAIEHLATYTGALSELLLINLGDTSAEQASETVRELLEISFGESK